MAVASGMTSRACSEDNAVSFLNAFLVDARLPHKVLWERERISFFLQLMLLCPALANVLLLVRRLP